MVGGAFFSGTEREAGWERRRAEQEEGFLAPSPTPPPKREDLLEEEEEEERKERSLTNSERCDGESPNLQKEKFK